FEGWNVVVGVEERRGLPPRECRGASRQPLEPRAVESDDRLGERAVGADVEERRYGPDSERHRGRPRIAGVGRRDVRAEAAAEVAGRCGIVLRDGDDGESPVAGAADAVEKRPRQLAGRAGRLEDRVNRFAAGPRKRSAAFVGQSEVGASDAGLETGPAADYRRRRARVPSFGSRITKPMNGRSLRLTRRQFVTAAGTALAAGALPSLGCGTEKRSSAGRKKTLRILQWSHFVPRYDRWFDGTYVRQWGERHGTEVIVDHISPTEITARGAAEASARKGHDLFLFQSPPAAFGAQVLDLADVVAEVEKRHGPMVDLARKSTLDPKTGKYFAFS